MLYSNWTEPTWLKRASETFEKFKNQVEKEGFFLGLYYDIDKDCMPNCVFHISRD